MRPARRPLFFASAALFAYALAVLWSAFRAGRFAFHDLGLIGDFLASGPYGRGLFRISDAQVSHLTVHFTPSLILLMPLYRLFDSQFVLLAAGAVALAAAAAIELAAFTFALDRLAPGDSAARRIAPAAFLVLAAWGTYSKSVLFSAHFEIFYLPLASAALLLALRGGRPLLLALAALLALGVRQDAGLYLCFQSLSLLLLPRALAPDRRAVARRALALAAASAVYTALAVRVFMPLCGAPKDRYVEQWWGRYGTTWGGVLWGALTHPLSVARDVALSGFPRFTLELGLLPLASLPAYLAGSLPGLLLFTASPHDKNQLDFYNSAFLLPGALLCAGAGLARLVAWEQRARHLPQRSPRATAAAARAFRFALWAVPLALLLRGDHAGGAGPARWTPDPHLPVRAVLRRALSRCPAVGAVAADFASVVFVPNRFEKLLPQHFERAQLVLLDDTAPALLSGSATVAGARARVEASGLFTLVEEEGTARAYLRRGIGCD